MAIRKEGEGKEEEEEGKEEEEEGKEEEEEGKEEEGGGGGGPLNRNFRTDRWLAASFRRTRRYYAFLFILQSASVESNSELQPVHLAFGPLEPGVL